MRATFEEKTYESYFNTELSMQTEIYFPLGQVQEGSLGFDSSAMTNNRSFWNRFWIFPPLAGVDLIDIANEMEHYLSVTLNNIPKIKANLLFQFKKPEYITRSNGREWANWNTPYYRYDIYKEQQELLLHIDNTFGDKVFIVYAAPALHDVNALVNAFINRQVIDISNFRRASELSGHQRNTYIQSGQYSIACSEPEKLNNFDLIKEINKLTYEESTDENNSYSIINFSKQLATIINKNKYYSDSFKKLNERFSEFIQYELLYSHLILHNFNQLTGTQWLVKI